MPIVRSGAAAAGFPTSPSEDRADTAPDPVRGLFERTIAGKRVVVEYETDNDLSETEQVPLLEGGIEAFIRREVLSHVADAWYDPASVKVGYEISFTRYSYKPQRSLDEIRADILALERDTEGLLAEIVGGVENTHHNDQESSEGAAE